jgi:hypothetical protein
MSIQPTSDLLSVLRANLARIEKTPEQNQTPAAQELRALILKRIANIDAAISRTAEPTTTNSEPKSGSK